MHSSFSRDLADADQPIREAARERAGAIRVRVQPTILRQGQYRTWKDVRWTLQCASVGEALAARDAMEAFFKAMGERGPKALRAALTKALKEEAA